MVTLVPTVLERLARCATTVYLEGIVPGSTVELEVGTDVSSVKTDAENDTFTVPPLATGALVRARQDAGSGFTPWSPAVLVEDVLVPPEAAPLLPEEIVWRSPCVQVRNLVPGCVAELTIDGQVVGRGYAGCHGNAAIELDPGERSFHADLKLVARMQVCGKWSPAASAPFVSGGALPIPVLTTPLFAGQRTLTLSNLSHGTSILLESNFGNLGSFRCLLTFEIRLDRPLVAGELVRARQFRPVPGNESVGLWSDWSVVVPPDERIRPEILNEPTHGDRIVRVGNQIRGASLTVCIEPFNGPPQFFGPRPVGSRLEIALNAPLNAGDTVTITQTLDGHAEESERVITGPYVLAPVILAPLLEGGVAVQVSRLHPRGKVVVHQDGIPIGSGWAGEESSSSIPVSPALTTGHLVTAIQTVGPITSLPSTPVLVETPDSIQAPRILEPLAVGDTQVIVSGVTPGARVTLRCGEEVLGEGDAAEPVVRIAVSPVAGPVVPSVRLGSKSAKGAPLAPITPPDAPGPWTHTAERFLSLTTFRAPEGPDGSAFDIRIQGQLYYPVRGDDIEPSAVPMPLVVIAHGDWRSGSESYKGYDYLAHHLAQWGMLVFSLDMDEVHDQPDGGNTYQYARGEIILRAIEQILGQEALEKLIDRNRIGLIGHSMSGEGVVLAQHLNLVNEHGLAIRGIVSLAPTYHIKEIRLRETRYLQLQGSMDVLLSRAGKVTGSDDDAYFSGLRIYDKAERPKTHFWIYKARHNPFNRQWVASGDTLEEGIAPRALAPEKHELVARSLINAFFQDSLFGKAAYSGYLEGTILPACLRGIEIHTQHSREPRVVVDNFGDSDTQAGLAEFPTPLDSEVNSLGGRVSATGGGLGRWQDVPHTLLAHSPHGTKSTRLSWRLPNVTYTTEIGGRSLALTDVVSLRIGLYYEDSLLNPVGDPIDLFVALGDGKWLARVRLGTIAQVPYPDAKPDVLAVMRTMRLPVDAFKAAQPKLDLGNILFLRLELISSATGHILVDDIEIGG